MPFDINTIGVFFFYKRTYMETCMSMLIGSKTYIINGGINAFPDQYWQMLKDGLKARQSALQGDH